jgi:hypothetical protein
MEFTAKYDLLRDYTGAIENPTNEIKVSLTDDEGEKLKQLVIYLEIDKLYIGDLAWFMEQAKQLRIEEDDKKRIINIYRNNIYRPKLEGEPPCTEEEAEYVSNIWNKYNKIEETLTEKKKLNRDRKLYQEYKSTSIALRSGNIKDLKSVDLFFNGGKRAKISEKYLLNLIKQDLKKKYLRPLECLIEIIGENKNVETASVRKRKEFAQRFYQFLICNVVNKGIMRENKFEYKVSDYRIYELIAGIMYYAGLERPSSQKCSLPYEIGKNNEEYRKYVLETLLGLRKEPTNQDDIGKILAYDSNKKRQEAKKAK